MTAAVVGAYRLYELPWSPSAEAEQRFRRILRNVLGGCLVAGLLMPFLPLPERVKPAAPVIPERIVRLVVEQPKPPPPPPPVVQPEPEVKPEVKAEVKPEPRVAEVRPVPKPAPVVDRRQQAREKAARSGLMAFADDLADLRDNTQVDRISGARAVTGNVGDAAQVERSLLTAKTGAGSGGINTASLSRNTGGAGLAGRQVTRVAAAPVAGSSAAEEGSRTSDGRGARSREEIEMVFDQNKSAIFALYNRALRANPELQGKLVLKLTIEPGGEVSECSIVSSELKDEELERKLVARVKMFRFQAKDVPAVTTTKPIDFFPA